MITNRPGIGSHISRLSLAGAWFLVPPAFAGVAVAQTVDAVGIAPEVVLEDRYPERRTEFPDGVTGLADVVYSVPANFRPLTLDLYLPPAGPGEPRYPVLVYVHGGGWMSGHTRHSGTFSNWPAALAAIANEGFVVASVEYRLSGEAPFPAAFDDVRAAIRWLRAESERLRIDRSRVVVMGGSAGGQLAGLVGTACGNNVYPDASTDTPEQDTACVQGVIAWYGIFDFGQIVRQDGADTGGPVRGPVAMYLDCTTESCNSETVRKASPISFVDVADPPFLMIHGVDDPVAPIEQSRSMHTRMKEVGAESSLIEIPGVKHSFVGTTPDATMDASRKAFDESVAFLKRVTGAR